MLHTTCFLHEAWERPISGNEFSSSLDEEDVDPWPTPNSEGGTGYMSGSNRDTWRPTLEGRALGYVPRLHRGREERSQTEVPWPTPKATQAGSLTQSPSGGPPQDLAVTAREWPTPLVGTGPASHGQISGIFRERMAEAMRDWPTPKAEAKDGRRGLDPRHGRVLDEEASNWPTPMVPNGGRVNTREEIELRGSTERGKRQVSLESVAGYWPTPKTPTGGPEGRDSKAARGSGGGDLQAAAETWPTPTANRSPYQNSHGKERPTLPGAAESWPTPRAGDWHETGDQEALAAKIDRGAAGGAMLPRVVAKWDLENWPTPTQGDAEGGLTPRKVTRESPGRGVALRHAADQWPTPRAEEKSQHNSQDEGVALSKKASEWKTPMAIHGAHPGITHPRHLTGQAQEMWPTPDASVGTGYNQSASPGAAKRPLLASKARDWPTPRSEDSESAGNHPGATDSLTGATRNWATPRAQDSYERSNRKTVERAGRGEAQMTLSRDAELWATPAARDYRSAEGSRIRPGHAPPLPEQVHHHSLTGPPDPPISTNGEESSLTSPTSRPLWRTPATTDTGTPPEKLMTKEGEPAKLGERMYREGPDGEMINQTQSLELQVSVQRGRRAKLNPRFTSWLMGLPSPDWQNPMVRIDRKAFEAWVEESLARIS